MASRKDPKGRVLRKGETFRKADEMYVYSYRDRFNKRRYVYSKNLSELRSKEEEVLKDQVDNIDTYVAGNADLNYLFDRYIETKTALRVSTKSNYIGMYDRYVRSGFGTRKINTIKYTDIIYFYNHLMNEVGLSYTSVEYIQRIIRPSLERAVKDGVLRMNPASGIMQEFRVAHKKDMVNMRHALTIEQERAFLSYIGNHPRFIRWKPLITFFFGTGCRVGEVVGLRWDDVDMENRTIDINHSFFYFGGRNNKTDSRYVLNDPKTESGKRVIPMVEPVYEALLEEKRMQEILGVSCKSVVCGMTNFIFCNRFQSIHLPEGINRQLNNMIEEYNLQEEVKAAREHRKPEYLPHFTCHSMRHTFCSRLCEADANVKVIQSLMGHTDIKTTLDIYAEVSQKKKKDSLEEIYKSMELF